MALEVEGAEGPAQPVVWLESALLTLVDEGTKCFLLLMPLSTEDPEQKLSSGELQHCVHRTAPREAGLP